MAMICVRRIVATTLTALTLCLATALPVYASTYNCGAYGAGDYQTSTCAATTEAPATQTPVQQLENTGQRLLPIIIPALFILAGTTGLFFARRKKHDSSPGNDMPKS